MKILLSIENLIDRLCVVAGAFIGSQIPAFIQQYIQRLAGHVDELQYLINQLRQLAEQSHKGLEQYIQKFILNSDPEFVSHGVFMQNLVSRWTDLQKSLFQLTNSSALEKPFAFLKGLNYDITQSTIDSFQPSINLGVEGICYAGAGGLLGWAFYRLLSNSITFGYTRVVASFKSSI